MKKLTVVVGCVCALFSGCAAGMSSESDKTPKTVESCRCTKDGACIDCNDAANDIETSSVTGPQTKESCRCTKDGVCIDCNDAANQT